MDKMRIGDYILKLQSFCPEVHEVRNLNGEYAGYFRVDRKVFKAYARDGELVLVAHTEGYCFLEDEESSCNLENGVIAIASYYKEKQNV